MKDFDEEYQSIQPLSKKVYDQYMEENEADADSPPTSPIEEEEESPVPYERRAQELQEVGGNIEYEQQGTIRENQGDQRSLLKKHLINPDEDYLKENMNMMNVFGFLLLRMSLGINYSSIDWWLHQEAEWLWR